MEKVKIELLPEVINFLNNLVKILFQKEYFGFEDSALNYVQNIYDFIENELHNFPHKQTPLNLKRFGSNYVFYKSNDRTTWYIFFERKQNRVLITHITNNHLEEINDL